MLCHLILRNFQYVAHRLVFSTGLVSKGSREQAVNAAFAQVEVPTEEWTK